MEVTSLFKYVHALISCNEMYKEIHFVTLHKNTHLLATKEKHYKTFKHKGIKITVQEKHYENKLSLALTHHFHLLSWEY